MRTDDDARGFPHRRPPGRPRGPHPLGQQRRPNSATGGSGAWGSYVPSGGSYFGSLDAAGNPVHVNPVIAGAVYLAVAIGVVLVTSRAGRGSTGDAVGHLTAIDATGAPVGRWRNLANAALPVLAWFAAALVTNPRAGLLAVVVLWAPALLRPDRRSLYSLVTGTHYGVLPGYVRRKGPKQPPVQING